MIDELGFLAECLRNRKLYFAKTAFSISNQDVKTKIISVHQLTEEQIRQMFGVMNEYYNKVTANCFRADLLEKQKVILLLRADGSICGFSTIVECALEVGGRKVIALFSGRHGS